LLEKKCSLLGADKLLGEIYLASDGVFRYFMEIIPVHQRGGLLEVAY